MNHEIAGASERKQAKLRVESLPFSEIPHQSRLFLDYLGDPLSLRKYYPNAVGSIGELKGFARDVLANYTTNRGVLCDALTQINRNVGAGEATFENIELLRKPDTVAVVTGQQAGLFTGPLYTIYKAMSAIKTAQLLSASGTPAVPVFWVASEDHDFDEVSRTFFLGAGGELVEAGYAPAGNLKDAPVGEIKIDAAIKGVIGDVFADLGQTDGADTVRASLESAWAAGTSFSAAFAKDLATLLGKFGMIFVDPLDERLKKLSSSIYVDAIQNAAEIVSTIRGRSADLESESYHAEVLVEDNYFPLFWHTDDGRRVALRKAADNVYRSKDEGREFTLAELAAIARDEPQRFSPGVMLRPVVQDHLLPTICYFGGAAEIAYFAENSEAYRVLGRPVTPITHRQSFTIAEPKEARAMEKLGITLTDLFEGLEVTTQKAVERIISPETATLFAEVEERISTELDRLDHELSSLDPTLAANLATRRRKIIYHIAVLKKKAYGAKLRKEATVERRLHSLFNSLLPKGELQERVINADYFEAKYGPAFIDLLYEAVNLDDAGHRVIYI